MSAPQAAPALRIALYEGEGAAPMPAAQRQELAAALLAKGHAVSAPGVGASEVACDGGALLVLGCFTGPVPAGRVDAGAVAVRFQEVAGLPAGDVLALVAAAQGERGAAWKPWFPVIDYDRCTNCMQCLSFCLFDVYGSSKDGKIEVQNPGNCKTNCPACSRVCPEVAIVFPKYKSGPINGDQVNADDVRREVMKVDISSLLGGDIYQTLRDRSAKAKSRFSKERDSDRALGERARCLAKLKEQLDIPAEVLNALPDLQAIAAKRASALQKAAEPQA